MEVYAHQNETVDALCYRVYGKTADMVEMVCEANPGLAALGPLLPHGTLVICPPQTQTRPSSATTINLWD